MKRMTFISVFGVLAITLFFFSSGWAQSKPESKASMITHSFAIEKGYYGYVWKIHIEAEDPEGDMYKITSTVDQPGWGHYFTDTLMIKPQFRKNLKGYLQWNTFSSNTSYLREFTIITLKVSIFDKAGNESNVVFFPFEFVSRAVPNTNCLHRLVKTTRNWGTSTSISLNLPLQDLPVRRNLIVRSRMLLGSTETVPKKARRGPFYLFLIFLSWNGKNFLSIYQKEESMRRETIALLLIILIGSLWMACSSTVSEQREEPATAEQKASAPYGSKYYSFADILIPAELNYKPKESVILRPPNLRWAG